MGLRYYRRVGGNKGLGLNVSGSGISPSYRTSYGSISAKGFSIRTGIPGLRFYSAFGRGKNAGNFALIMLVVIVLGFTIYYSTIVVYNVILFTLWIIKEIIKFILRLYYKWRGRNELSSTN
jgi:hypothetical protein